MPVNRVSVSWRTVVSVVAIVTTFAAGCGSTKSQTAPTTRGAGTFTADSIPTLNQAADTGCLDTSGKLHAHAREWYPAQSGSALGLGGETGTSPALNDFVASATDALKSVAPGYVPSHPFELHQNMSGCATHRYARFTNGDDEVVVSAWRVESAASAYSVPNETDFIALDDTTLVSRGKHIAVVLVVAPDGTTSRVTAYGARASDMVSGWPTTTMGNPGAGPPGPAPISADELIPIARAVLAFVLAHR